jgi:tetratricopeptide (TPR) repeat protein
METLGVGAYHSLLLVRLGEACLLDHRLEEAIAIGDRALQLCRERGERGYEAWALRFLGEVALHHDPLDLIAAEGHYSQALVQAGELSMRPLVVHCHFGLGRLCQRTGKREEAQQHLSTATAMYGEMGMHFWLEQAQAELSSLG